VNTFHAYEEIQPGAQVKLISDRCSWDRERIHWNNMQVPGTHWTDEEKVIIKKPLLELANFIGTGLFHFKFT